MTGERRPCLAAILSMNAQYYYIDPESQRTCGPFNFETVKALHEQNILDRTTLVCRVIAEEWQPFEDYPELTPPPAAALPAVAGLTPPHEEPSRAAPVSAVVAAVCGLVLAAGLGWWKTAPRPVSVAAAIMPPVPTTTPPPAPAATPGPTPVPSAPPEGNVERGTEIANRILEQYPKLKVAVISGITFQKPDGIELYGKGAFGASICFILPEEAWDALGDQEKLDLEAYVAGKVAWVRDHAEDYMIIPRSAPDYAAKVERARHLIDGAWRIGSTQVYLDDLDRNLYLKRVLVKGPAY